MTKCWFGCGKEAVSKRKLGIITVDVCEKHETKETKNGNRKPA